MNDPQATSVNRSDWLVIGGSVVAVLLAALTRYAAGGAVVAFLCSALAVTLLAALVGRSVEQLGDRFGPGRREYCSPRWVICLSCLLHFSRSRRGWSRWCRQR